MKVIIKNALLNSLCTAVYVTLVASFMFHVSQSGFGQEPNVFIPIFVLMLLVFSAGLTGALIFGRPILWFLEGKKKQAMQLLAYTFGFLFAIILIVFFIILLFNGPRMY